jgi:hypothetical protein
MPIVYNIDGHWFHSRSSSTKSELEHISRLVIESQNPKYGKLKWSENVPLAEELASTIGIKTSTMRTKIRAFIRFGFLKEKRECPLEWLSLGLIWESLTGYTDPKIKTARNDVEQLIISAALELYSFDAEGYQINPSEGFNPLTTLILNLDSEGKISRKDFARLVGSRNETYWLIDLLRSGMFTQKNSHIFYTGKFPILFESCKKVSWPKSLKRTDWEKIHEDFLDPRNPLSEAIKEELFRLLNHLREDVLRSVPKVERSIDKMEEILQKQDEKDIEIGNYSIPDTFSKARVRAKQNAWSNIVKKVAP